MQQTKPQATRTDPNRSTFRVGGFSSPPALLLWGMLAQIALHLPTPRWILIPWPWTLLGMAPLAAGIALMAAGDREFARRRTPIQPGTRPTTLVTTGVFAWSRNPMYAGIVIVLLGVAVLFGTAIPFLVVPVSGRLLTVRFIRYEEVALGRRFGRDYDEYASMVPRWLAIPGRRGGG